jgi:hypothetical protein
VPTKKTPAKPEPVTTDADAETIAHVKAVQEEARGSFDLLERLAGLHYRRDKVVLFMDAQAGATLEAMELQLQRAHDLIATVEPGTPQHQGLIETYTAAEEEKLALEAELMKTALSVHMQAIPDPAHDKARRAARKAVGVKGSVIPEEQRETYVQVLTDQLLGACMTTVIDPSGAQGTFDRTKIGRKLREILPIPQHARLVAKMNDLVFNDALARQATSDPGF